MLCHPSDWVGGPVLWPGKGLASPHLCARALASLGNGCPLLLASVCFPYFVLSLGAGHSAGFLIPLLGVLLLVVVCTAATAVVTMARKVRLWTPRRPLWPFQILLLSRDRHRRDPPLPFVPLSWSLFCLWGKLFAFSFCASLIWEPESLDLSHLQFPVPACPFGQSPGV